MRQCDLAHNVIGYFRIPGSGNPAPDNSSKLVVVGRGRDVGEAQEGEEEEEEHHRGTRSDLGLVPVQR